MQINCTVAATPCACDSADRCANASVVKGIKNRGDADDCCCPSGAPLIWSDSKAKCMEVKKCHFACCASGTKMCNGLCCDESEKCMQGKCIAEAPSPSPSPSPPSPSPPCPATAPGGSWPGSATAAVVVLALLLVGGVGGVGCRRAAPRQGGAVRRRCLPCLRDDQGQQFALQPRHEVQDEQ
mmetsp:Transcript_74619/g.241515  ORF Transcript_74619/g.241515 Transcript_74619/m.241515 type:complete len:182 (-) Transcript_74619:59-604(-)